MTTRRSNWMTLLLVTNAITLLLLFATWYQIRLFPKAYQRFTVEQRIPLLVPEHRINRSFQSTRLIHQLYDASQVKTLVIGDSLVSQVSWPELMADPTIVGRGIPGDVVQGVLERMPDYQELQIERVVFLVGSNDSIRNHAASVGATLGEVRGTAKSFWPMAEILQCTLPPVSAWIENAERVNADNSAINAQLVELSITEGFSIVDLALELTEPSGYLKGEYTSDGIHLNAAGYDVVREQLRKHIR